MTDRQRRAVTVKVNDGVSGSYIVTAYEGMLPEEMLQLLIEQRLTLHARKLDDTDVKRVWHGPSENIQQALTGGLASSSQEE